MIIRIKYDARSQVVRINVNQQGAQQERTTTEEQKDAPRYHFIERQAFNARSLRLPDNAGARAGARGRTACMLRRSRARRTLSDCVWRERTEGG